MDIFCPRCRDGVIEVELEPGLSFVECPDCELGLAYKCEVTILSFKIHERLGWEPTIEFLIPKWTTKSVEED